MNEIEHFLSEFGSVIFDEHLELILGFQIKYVSFNNSANDISCSQTCSCYEDVTDTCSCFYYRKEKEKVISLMERYYKLCRYFTTSRNIAVRRSSLGMSRERKILKSPVMSRAEKILRLQDNEKCYDEMD